MIRPTFEQLEPLFERFPAISIINLVECLNRAFKNGDRIARDTFEDMIYHEQDKLIKQGWTEQQLRTTFYLNSRFDPSPEASTRVQLIEDHETGQTTVTIYRDFELNRTRVRQSIESRFERLAAWHTSQHRESTAGDKMQKASSEFAQSIADNA